ncbi:MAG TPA: RNA polymerase sigma factor [Longimicrobiales bacterium]
MAEPDARLVERAREGDADAFEMLVRRHLRAAFLAAIAVVGERADAEDVCQDAFITALERLEECRKPARFAAWLLKIVRNRAHSHRRYLDVRRAAPLREDLHAPGAVSSPARAAERAELRDELKVTLGTLPEVQREVLLLHDLEGWRHREIAELLGLPEGTVRAHLSYARKAMRERLVHHRSEGC